MTGNHKTAVILGLSVLFFGGAMLKEHVRSSADLEMFRIQKEKELKEFEIQTRKDIFVYNRLKNLSAMGE